MKTCPTGCGRKPRSGCYLCTECWYALPREQRRQFNNAYRKYRRSQGADHFASKAHAIALEQYRAARAEAVVAARRMMQQPEARA
ncbi:MAG: hypothetical protein Q8R21_00010 [Burkholderiales bacterium]|nr:hypothetical protein [Burkholderiales bacterium]